MLNDMSGDSHTEDKHNEDKHTDHKKFGNRFEELASRLLDEELSHVDRDSNPASKGTGRVRAGLSIFYFEEELPAKEEMPAEEEAGAEEEMPAKEEMPMQIAGGGK